MIDLVKAWYRRKIAEQGVALEEAQVQGKTLETAHKTLEEVSNLVTERQDEGGWTASGSILRDLQYNDRQSMIRQARKFYRFDPNARAALMTAASYIIGEGLKITPQSEDPRVHKLWREFWTSERNNMTLRQMEIVLRTLRDGEVYLEYFQKDEDGAPSWKTTVRFRDPELLQQPPMEYGGPGGMAMHGILVDKDDIEKPIKYFFKHSYQDQTTIDTLPADQVQRIKIFSDSEQKRGESYLMAAMDVFTQYQEWLRYRIILNKVRTAIVMIKKVDGGTAADIQALQNTIGTSPTARTGDTKKRLPRPGTVLTANGGVDYRFESANINASDAAEDGRNLKLAMAAALNLPEYVFGDASNANYASSLIAESPFVKGIKFWQLFFEHHFKDMFRRVIQSAVTAGMLQAPPEDDIFENDATKKTLGEATAVPPVPPPPPGVSGSQFTKIPKSPKVQAAEDASAITEAEAFWGCDVQWPEIQHREIDKTTTAILAQKDAGLISDATACSILGYDYDEEIRKQLNIENESETNPFKNKAQPMDPNADPNADDGTNELNDVMGTLTPDESHQILKSSDPKSVMALIKAKKKPAPVAKAKGVVNA